MKPRSRGCLTVLVSLLLGLPFLGGAAAEERASEGAPRGAAKEASADKTPGAVPAASATSAAPEAPAATESVKDHAAIWVFLAWVWGATIVSMGFLRLKIKECDRLHEMAFHEASRRPPGRGL